MMRPNWPNVASLTQKTGLGILQLFSVLGACSLLPRIISFRVCYTDPNANLAVLNATKRSFGKESRCASSSLFDFFFFFFFLSNGIIVSEKKKSSVYHMRTAKVQIIVCILAIWSGHSFVDIHVYYNIDWFSKWPMEEHTDQGLHCQQIA